ncbi:vitamin B12 transporter BtuB precursor [mine drainage metagenome]|uniref:Vitamin B12 transporter BtuB n=1 Tax=mine drainage metagenome TaxID=410659 RepID=A0A1J5SB99_9ZZZZ
MSKKLTLLSTSMLVSILAFSQQDTLHGNELNPVIVTANKTEQKQSTTGKIVTVIDQKMIKNNEGRNLSELLNTQAGFYINGSNNALGTNQDVYFRGAGAGNMLVVIDGIPVFDPSEINNTFDFNSIPLQQIERIEILKGGQSTLWGSDAVAGVIQIFLKKEAKKQIAVNSSISYGTYNTIRAVAGASGTIDKLGYNVQYNYIKSKGFPMAYDSTGKLNFKDDGFEQSNIQASLHYALSKSLTIKGFGNFSIYNNDLAGGAFTDEKDYTAKNSNNLGGVNLKYKGKGFIWNIQGSYQQAKRHLRDDSTYISNIYSIFSEGKYTGNTTTLETFGSKQLAKHVSLVSGLQYISQNTDQSYFSTGSFGPYASSLGKDSAKINQTSVYASLLITDIKGFNFEAGGRLNHHSIYGNKGTFTINPSYNIDEHTKLFINISSAYKIPSLYQLYSEYGNKSLKPESSTTYEFGIQTQLADSKTSFRIAAFKRDIINLIIFYTDPVTYNSYYINGDKQNDYGFELESNIQLASLGNWSNNFSFVDGQGTQNGVKVDNLYRRPKFVVNSSLTLQPCKHITVIPSFKYVGSRLKGPYDIGPAEQPAYYTVDCFLGYQANKAARLFIDLHNITNQQYFDIVGYNSKRFNMMAGIDIQF